LPWTVLGYFAQFSIISLHFSVHNLIKKTLKKYITFFDVESDGDIHLQFKLRSLVGLYKVAYLSTFGIQISLNKFFAEAFTILHKFYSGNF